MARPLDYKQVQQLLSPLELLRARGWAGWREANGSYRGPCPIHGSHSKRSRSLWVGSRQWRCWVCHRQGDVCDLLAWLDTITPYEAALRICQAAGQPVPYIPSPSPI